MRELERLVEKFFELANITIDELKIDEEQSGIFKVIIQTPDSGIVIGPHGKNIPIFANIIKLMFAKKLDARARVHFDVNDYGEQKEEKFFKFIESKIKYVRSSGHDVKLPFLSSYERKKVHSFIADKPDDTIFTKSIGDGAERRLFICKKSQALTIDIDGDDI